MAEEKFPWTEHEDKLIADTVLDFVSRGKTITDALTSVSYQLKVPRSLPALRFRWVNTVRPRVEHDFDQARKRGIEHVARDDDTITPDELADKIKEYVKQFRVVDVAAKSELETLRERLTELEEKVSQLEAERKTLQAELMRR